MTGQQPDLAEAAVVDFLVRYLDVAHLRDWLLLEFPGLVGHIVEGSVTRYDCAAQAVDALKRHGLLDGEFLMRLSRRVPQRAEELAALSGGRLAFPPSGSDLPLPSPEADYDSAWVVSRGDIERQLSTGLTQRLLLLLYGPSRHGRSFLLQTILSRHITAEHQPVWVGLKSLDPSRLESGPGFALELIGQIADQVDQPPPMPSVGDITAGTWSAALSDWLGALLSIVSERRLVLMFDDLQVILPYDELREHFFHVLRSWVERGKAPTRRTRHWRQLQLVTTMSAHLDALDEDTHGSLFKAAAYRIDVMGLSLEETRGLARMHGVHDESPFSLHDYVGGHPFLLRRALFESRRRNVPLPRLIADPALRMLTFGPFIDHCRARLEAAKLLVPLREMINGRGTPSGADSKALWAAGCLDDARTGLRCRLYEELRR